MRFLSIDPETHDVSELTHIGTVKELSRCVCVSIGRWILSGQDCPDYRATDGVSEFESALVSPVEW